MKITFYIFVVLTMLTACADRSGPETTAVETEIKFNILKKETKSPEYELTFFRGNKIIAKRVYKNGQTIASEGVIPDGQVVEKYENGNIKNLFSYKNGKREGKAIGYYQNGKVKIESIYKNGEPFGISKTYYEDGKLLSESEIIDGRKKYYKEYYKNGQLKEEVTYRSGKSISKTYDESGNLIRY